MHPNRYLQLWCFVLGLTIHWIGNGNRDKMDRKRKADDPCDVTVRKKENSGDVTDKMDRKRKANDSRDDTVRKKANSGDVTEECLSSVDDVLPTPQGSSQSTSHDVMNCEFPYLFGLFDAWITDNLGTCCRKICKMVTICCYILPNFLSF